MNTANHKVSDFNSQTCCTNTILSEIVWVSRKHFNNFFVFYLHVCIHIYKNVCYIKNKKKDTLPHINDDRALWYVNGKDCFECYWQQLGTIHYCIKTELSVTVVGKTIYCFVVWISDGFCVLFVLTNKCPRPSSSRPKYPNPIPKLGLFPLSRWSSYWH